MTIFDCTSKFTFLEIHINERLRRKLHRIIYEADTPTGKLFDIILLILILISIAAIMFESVAAIRFKYGHMLHIIEWTITILFTIEYIARILTVRKPIKYVLSAYGIIDLLAILPSYISLLLPGAHLLASLRAVRLLRVFRILKLGHFVGASHMLMIALRRSRDKIFVFLFTVIILCVIFGTLMYMIEGPLNGFSDIPVSIYWTIVTLTTVGFGDITPQTGLGQFLSMVIMIMGYGIIAVPTGIVTSEIVNKKPGNQPTNTTSCPNCNETNHKDYANFCYNCGGKLHAKERGE